MYKYPQLKKSEFIETSLAPVLDIVSKEKKVVALLGDYNIDLTKDENNDFIDVLCSNAFFPVITIPTRITDHSETLIDNIFINSNRYPIIAGNLLVGISDHLPQFALMETDAIKDNTSVEKYYLDWKSFNENQFIEKFKQIDWKSKLQLEQLDPDLSFKNFFNNLTIMIENHVPLKKVSKKQYQRKAWITRGIHKSIQCRDKLFKQFKSEKDSGAKVVKFQQYKRYRNQIVKLIRQSKKLHYRNFFTQYIQNPKKIWGGINELIKMRSSKSSNKITLKVGSEIKTDSTEIANEINGFFTNIVTKIRENIPPTKKSFTEFLSPPTRQSFFFSPITSQEIVKIIKGLDAKKATGPLSIPNKILIILIEDISVILSSIFNLSLTTGKFITSLKTAKVIALYKNKGSEQEVQNYRPITLLSNVDKIFEKLVHNRLINYLDRYNILFERQFGFRKRHATIHNLITLTEKVRKDLDKGDFSCSVFLDLQKAFDSVDHAILLKKLEIYGIRGLPNKWFQSYLMDRKQFVEIQGERSSLSDIKFGVPQGSVLGPLLFLIYVNDLQNSIIYSTAFIFADDTAINYANKSLKALKKRINIDLKLLSHWLHANKIAVNVTKTETILFRDPHKKFEYNVKLKLQGKLLKFTNQTKYLGVYIDENLNWKYQIDKLAMKLRQANGVLSKLRHFVVRETLIQIYYAIFQSHLNYSLQVWGQNLSVNNRLFILQKTALRLMTFSRPDASSQPLFKQLKIPTIKELIFSSNIKTVYNVLKQLAPTGISNALDLTYVRGRIMTRGNSKNLLRRCEVRTSTYGLHSIKYTSIVNWNSLQNFSKTKLTDFTYSKIKSITREYLSLH